MFKRLLLTITLLSCIQSVHAGQMQYFEMGIGVLPQTQGSSASMSGQTQSGQTRQQKNQQAITTLSEPQLLWVAKQVGITIPANYSINQTITALSNVNKTSAQAVRIGNAIYQVQQINQCRNQCAQNM